MSIPGHRESRPPETLAVLAQQRHIDLRLFGLVNRDDAYYEELRQRPGESATIRKLRGDDCRENLLPLVTPQLVHALLDPRIDPSPDNDYDGWYLVANIAPAVLSVLDPDHPMLFQIDDYYKRVSAKVGWILRSSDSIERKPYDGASYLYRYTDDDLVTKRERDRRRSEAASEAARDRSLQLRLRADKLGVRIIEQGIYFGIRAEELEKLLTLAEKGSVK